MKNESPLSLAGHQGQYSESVSSLILLVRAKAVKNTSIHNHGTRNTCPCFEAAENFFAKLIARLDAVASGLQARGQDKEVRHDN